MASSLRHLEILAFNGVYMRCVFAEVMNCKQVCPIDSVAMFSVSAGAVVRGVCMIVGMDVAAAYTLPFILIYVT